MSLILIGNGIQQAFYQDPDVLYISLHVHEGGKFYPEGPYGNHYHCGAKLGEGKYEIVIYRIGSAVLKSLQEHQHTMAYEGYG